MASHRAAKTGGKKEGMSSEKSFYVTPGKVLTPWVFAGTGGSVLATPNFPQKRGDAKPVGSEPIPRNVGKTFKGNNALKAFGLNGTGRNEK